MYSMLLYGFLYHIALKPMLRCEIEIELIIDLRTSDVVDLRQSRCITILYGLQFVYTEPDRNYYEISFESNIHMSVLYNRTLVISLDSQSIPDNNMPPYNWVLHFHMIYKTYLLLFRASISYTDVFVIWLWSTSPNIWRHRYRWQ